MKVAVIGSRNFNDYEEVEQVLSSVKITLLVSGGAKGADTLGQKYAEEHNIETKIFLPDWKKYGKKAGFLNESELVVAFWDGFSKGTLDSIKKAEKKGKNILLIRI
jgi:hypothetical protein